MTRGHAAEIAATPLCFWKYTPSQYSYIYIYSYLRQTDIRISTHPPRGYFGRDRGSRDDRDAESEQTMTTKPNRTARRHLRIVPIEPVAQIAKAALDTHRDHRGWFEYGADNTHQAVLGIQRNHWLKLVSRKFISAKRADALATHLGYHPKEIWGHTWDTTYDPIHPTESRAA